MLHNLLDDAQTFSLRMSADSKSLQNARAIVSEIVQIDALSHDTFEQMRAIIRAHIETCGKKQ